jgi:hypothetical protein
LYYSGRDNPPHPEIWAEYFLRMVLLYSDKVRQISEGSKEDTVRDSLSHLKRCDKEFLLFLLDDAHMIITPVDVGRRRGVSNRTAINRLSVLARNGFVKPNMVKERITSYELSDFTKEHKDEIRDYLERDVARSSK